MLNKYKLKKTLTKINVSPRGYAIRVICKIVPEGQIDTIGAQWSVRQIGSSQLGVNDKAKAQNSVGVQKTKPIPEGVRCCDGQKGSKFT